MYEIPNLLFADRQGNIYDHPHLKMTVRSENYNFVPYEVELIELPPGSSLYFVPDTHPTAYNPDTAGMETFTGGFAISALLEPGYLRLFLPAYEALSETNLPMYPYTAVGWLNGKFVVPAIKVDDDSKWNLKNFKYDDRFTSMTQEVLNAHPENRLYNHLANRALEFRDPAAYNTFVKRWECSIPTATTSNVAPLGFPSAHDKKSRTSAERIKFNPKVKEIVEVVLNHADKAKEPVVNFCQETGGDPIMTAETISKAVKVIKKKAPEVTLNFSSNCSNPEKMKILFDAGIDSISVTMNSVVHSTYDSYFNPEGYSLDDVLKSIELANRYNVYTSLNMLSIPGINDRESEADTFIDFLDAYEIDLIQMRNLNIDPDYLFSRMKFKKEEILGIKNLLKLIRKKKKNMKFGYFNRTKSDFYKDFGLPDLKRRYK